jgi:hypothetical protein
MLSFTLSDWVLIKFPDFADTTERGDRGKWKGGWRQGDFRGNSIIRIKSCKSCELIIGNLIDWYPVLLTLCLTQIGDESETSPGGRTRGQRHGDFKNNFPTYEVNSMGSFNALVFYKKLKWLKVLWHKLAHPKEAKEEKSSKENICICIFIFGNFHIFPIFWFFCLFVYEENLYGAFSMHTFF